MNRTIRLTAAAVLISLASTAGASASDVSPKDGIFRHVEDRSPARGIKPGETFYEVNLKMLDAPKTSVITSSAFTISPSVPYEMEVGQTFDGIRNVREVDTGKIRTLKAGNSLGMMARMKLEKGDRKGKATNAVLRLNVNEIQGFGKARLRGRTVDVVDVRSDALDAVVKLPTAGLNRKYEAKGKTKGGNNYILSVTPRQAR